MSATMFVADFASTFHHPLGLPRAVNFKQLQDAIAAEGQLDGREVLWELYEGLMRFLLNVSLQTCLCFHSPEHARCVRGIALHVKLPQMLLASMRLYLINACNEQSTN